MKAKKLFSIGLAALMLAALAGCNNNGNNGGQSGSSDSGATSGGALTTNITVISREDGSGTRGAFVELMGIEQKNAEGEKEDMTRPDAEINNSTNGVMMSVAGNPDAIGYISLGSLNDTVKALTVDGTEATADNIKAGKYAVARPFMLCYKEENLDELSKDFIKFIESTDGQTIISDGGYISIDASEGYTASGMSGTISCNGSTSVGPIMEKLGEKYMELNPDTKVEVQQTGSGAGITAATEGACSVGMSSRALKQEELDAGLTELKIADDGIAVIVNKENPLTNITSEQIMKIYTGEINSWGELN